MQFYKKFLMKNSLIILLLLFGANLYSQEETKNYEVQEYINKSVKQKKTANILLLSGATIGVIGFIISNTDDSKSIISGNQLLAGTFVTLGGVSMLTSIPFYISSSKNKSKSQKIKPEMGRFKTNDTHYFTAGLKLEF